MYCTSIVYSAAWVELGYSAIHPVVRQVLKMIFMEVPLASRLLLWLTPALVGGCNLSLNMHQNIANDWMNNAVFTFRSQRPTGWLDARLSFLPSPTKLLDFVDLRSTGFVFLLLWIYVRPPDTKPVDLKTTKSSNLCRKRQEGETGVEPAWRPSDHRFQSSRIYEAQRDLRRGVLIFIDLNKHNSDFPWTLMI